MSLPLPEGESSMWGVTVEQVSALAPHIGLTQKTNPDGSSTPVPSTWMGRADRQITPDEVRVWIGQVSARAAVRVGRVLSMPVTDPRRAVWFQAVQDAVANGAASYLVAAAFPMKADKNENTSYAEVLWRRFLDTIDELAAEVAKLPADTTAPAAPLHGVTGAFPAPMFTDGFSS